MRSWLAAAAGALVLVGVGAPSAAASFGLETRSYVVTAPTILTYSPYSVLGRNGDASRWVPRGYARAYADVVGTGNSGGCWDYGGIRDSDNNEDPSDEGLDTPLAFDFGLAIPPPLDATDPSWAERVASTVVPCDELEHTQRGYDDTPDYDAFWLERDYIVDAGRIDIPVLVAHNWGDWNVKQEEAIKLYRALTQ